MQAINRRIVWLKRGQYLLIGTSASNPIAAQNLNDPRSVARFDN